MSDIDYTHLVGRKFIWNNQDCFALFRDFYKDVMGISIDDYARPVEFWEHGLDIFRENYLDAGFSVLTAHPSEWWIGDVILSSIQSTVPNHCSIVVENGKILHHLYGRLSTVDYYKGLVRNTTIGVFRHKDATNLALSKAEVVNFLDLLSSEKRKKIDELRNASANFAE